MDAALADLEHVASQLGITLNELTEYTRKHEGKPYPVSVSTTVKIVTQNTLHFLYRLIQPVVVPTFNYSIALISGKKLDYVTPAVRVPNPTEVYKMILQAHGHEVFINGVFNGDPHPGNILLVKSKPSLKKFKLDSGKVGLIDYGQVKCISLRERKVTNIEIIKCAFSASRRASHFDGQGRK